MSWEPNMNGETILDTVGDFELVRVTFPFFLQDGRKARFWHLVVP